MRYQMRIMIITLIAIIACGNASAEYCTSKNWKIATDRGKKLTRASDALRDDFKKMIKEYSSIDASKESASARLARVEKLIKRGEKRYEQYTSIINVSKVTQNKWMVMRDRCFGEGQYKNADAAEAKADAYYEIEKSIRNTQKTLRSLIDKLALLSYSIGTEKKSSSQNCN